MSRYRFLLGRRWIAGALVAAIVAATCLELGLWQLRRLDERRTHNRLVASRSASPAVPLPSPLDVRRDAFRRVEARGRYDVSGAVLLTGRSLGGRPGNHVLVPLVAGGAALVVDRGWVPTGADPPPPPGGEVVVTGVLYPPEGAPRVIGGGERAGRLATIARVDLARLAAQMPSPLLPLYLRLTSEDPRPAGARPAIPPPERLGDGPHLSYAVQWFVFGTIALAGFGVLARHAARDRGRP